MSSLFSPAINLMLKLKYPYKFGLIGLLALISIVSLFSYMWIDLAGTIDFTQKEIQGIAPSRPLLQLLQNVQKHRTLSVNQKNFSTALREKYVVTESAIADAIKTIDTIDAKYGTDLKMSQEWKNTKTKWEDLKNKSSSLSPADNLAMHNDVINNILTTIAVINDNSGLILDPDVHSNYLIDASMIRMPDLLENLASLKTIATQAISNKTISDQDKVKIISTIAVIKKVSTDLNITLNKIIELNPSIQKDTRDFQANLNSEINKLLLKVNGDILSGTFTSASDVFFTETTNLIDHGFNQVETSFFPQLNTLLEARINQGKQHFYIEGSISFIAVALLVYMAIGAYFAIMASILSLAQGTEKIAVGDLTNHINFNSKDELELVARNFNVMTASMSRLIKDIRSEANDVFSSAASLSISCQEVLKSSGTQSDAAASMAAAVEEMTVSVEEINRHAQNAQSLSYKAGELSTEGNKVVNSVVDEMNALANTVNKSAGVIQALGQQSEKISAIVNAIKQIADQTNLLALNAAIEAARAGESGRGFAVVADEVRKLAERTTEATHEIAEMITSIQTGTNDAVESMQEGVSRVNHGVELVHQAGNSMQEVTDASNEVVRVVGDISVALKEQSIANTEIAKNVEKIAEMAEHNHSSVSNATSTAKELENLATKLRAGIDQFKVG